MDWRIGVVAAAMCFGVSNIAQAGPRDDALEAVAKCATLGDDHARLACYDAAAPSVKEAISAPPPAPPAPQVATQKEQESWFGLSSIFGGGKSAQSTPQQFGNENLPRPPPPPPQPGQPAPPQEIDSIAANVADYAIHLDGRFTIFLDNDQIWQQMPGDTDVVHLQKGHGNTVVITRGLFGSYNAMFNGHGRPFKVKRIK